MARTTHAQQLVNKPWGHELIIENDKETNLCMKILHINPGLTQKANLSWQFHKNKTETFLVTKGTITLYYGRTPDRNEAELIKLKVGDSFKVYPYQWHQMHNTNLHEYAEVIECSTFHEDSDTYRDAEDWHDTESSIKRA